MKKKVWLLATLVLAGCSAQGDGDTSSSAGTEVSASSVSSEVVSSTESKKESSSLLDTATDSLPGESSSTDSAGTGENDSSRGGGSGEVPGESADIALHIPDTLKQDEGSSLYEEVINVAKEFTETTAPLSEEGLFTLSYTGYYIENEDGKVQAYFIGVNRVGEPMQNLSFTLNFLVDDQPVWDDVRFTLHEDEFGTQPNNTAMPIFLDIPTGKEDLLMNAEPEKTFIEIKNLEVD